MTQEADDVIMALRDEDHCGGCARIVLKADMLDGACPECYKQYEEWAEMQAQAEQADIDEDNRRARQERELESYGW